jgi:hypothetical protein
VAPLVVKTCERSKHLQDETLPKLAHLFGQVPIQLNQFLDDTFSDKSSNYGQNLVLKN